MHGFDNGVKLEKKKDNWEQLSKIFAKYDIPLEKKDYEPVIHAAQDAVIIIIKQV